VEVLLSYTEGCTVTLLELSASSPRVLTFCFLRQPELFKRMVLFVGKTSNPTFLAQLLPETLKSPPTLNSVISLVGSEKFGEVITAARYLKEYAVGLEIAERLIHFMEASSALDLQIPEHRKALGKLWRSKLRFLDWADKWDEYVNSLSQLKERPILACECLISSAFVKDRLRIIEEKIARRNEGKRTTHLQHKQTWQLTDEEYERRREWLRTWRAYCRRCQESIRRAAGTRRRTG